MGVFRFKRFNVVNERSAMKVNTDGVLLGASMTIKSSDRRLLDVGTGTGTIALMAAQRLSELIGSQGQLWNVGQESLPAAFSVHAIDLDEASVVEAAENFRNSPWSECVSSEWTSLDEYSSALAAEVRFDHIFSNPPYFEDSLHAPEQRRNDSRHTSTGLSYRELLDFAKERLTENGRISLVLPAETETPLTRHARMCGLHLFRIVRVRTVPRKQPIRIIAEFSFERCSSPSDETLIIQSEGRYTDEYLALTRDFYLFA
jgi:tRNA1Val (adenine37-N6)-methyltransferase